MPVRQYNATRPPDQALLIDRLAQEWRAPDPTATEPVILEEPDAKRRVAHVFVIWSDWVQLDRIRRGEIIMDAAERVKSVEDLLNITIAMGLTPEEADRFGIKWR
jgi:hypothetical protein